MCNRLELEFPEVAWRALPPTGPGRVPPEVTRQCLTAAASCAPRRCGAACARAERR